MQVVVTKTIASFAPAAWNRLFPGELEDWAYYRATERAGLAGFEWLYVGVLRGTELRAVAPAFVTPYRLDTTLDGSLRTVVGGLAKAAPGLLRPRMLALGSPVAEACHVGFAPDSDASERAALFATLLDACEGEAENQRARLLAVKDLPAASAFETVLVDRGLRHQPGQATACLDIAFRDLDGYLATLGRATRRDLRRKWRSREQLRIEWRHDLTGISDQVVALYRQTLARASMRLEEITRDWFVDVMEGLAGRAACVCYWAGADLVAFNLVLHDGDRLIDKYIGMDYSRARALNLYYVSWLENVSHAIRNGMKTFQSGQGMSEEKARLGCRLLPNGLWYRHRNRMLNRAMALAERAFGLQQDPAPRECA